MPKTLPSSDASPFAGALNSTSATPPKASTANPSAFASVYSANSHAPIGTIRNGASDPISAAFATLLCVAPAKNTARFSPKKIPGTNTCRTLPHVTRRPVLHRTAFQRTLTVTIRQNATRTPGDSARLTSVELSENATTRPTTASTPSVFALNVPSRAGTSGESAAACGAALTGPHYAVERFGGRHLGLGDGLRLRSACEGRGVLRRARAGRCPAGGADRRGVGRGAGAVVAGRHGRNGSGSGGRRRDDPGV